MRCWHGYLSVQRLAYGPADATATPPSLLQKIQNGLSFWYWPTQVGLEKRPLNDCVRVCVFCIMAMCVYASLLNAVEFRRFVRPQHREQFMDICRGICGRDVFPRDSASASNHTAGCRHKTGVDFCVKARC